MLQVKRRSHNRAQRIKWWHLKGEKQRIFQHKILKGGSKKPQRRANNMRNKMMHEIKEVANEKLGESRGFGPAVKKGCKRNYLVFFFKYFWQTGLRLFCFPLFVLVGFKQKKVLYNTPIQSNPEKEIHSDPRG